VEERQWGEVHVVRRKLRRLAGELRVRVGVSMRHADALRGPGRPGRVHDGDDIVLVELGDLRLRQLRGAREDVRLALTVVVAAVES
jgi:hypothetical protein